MGGGGGPWGQCLGTLLMLVLESERQGPLGALIAAVNAVEEQLQLLGRGGGEGGGGGGWRAQWGLKMGHCVKVGGGGVLCKYISSPCV